jgi:hypothetical protein
MRVGMERSDMLAAPDRQTNRGESCLEIRKNPLLPRQMGMQIRHRLVRSLIAS